MRIKIKDSPMVARLFWAVAGGVALTCAFPGIGLPWCAWFALALLMIGLSGATVKESLLLGLAAGSVHFLTLLYWLVPTMHRYGPLPLPVSVAALLLLAFYLALYVAVFSGLLIGAARSGKFGHPAWCLVMVPVFWVALEVLRTYLFSGFPWGVIGYSQHKYLHFIQIADIFGVYGISFLLALTNAALFLLVNGLLKRQWQGREVRQAWMPAILIGTGIMIAGALVYGGWRIDHVDRMAASAEKMKVAAVQGNIAQSFKWDEAYRTATTQTYIDLSEGLKKHSPELVVWPETALPFYFFYDKELTHKVLAAVERVNTYFLIGSPAYEYDDVTSALTLYNTAYLIGPEGKVHGRYDKVHLVPFGEYVPLKEWLPFLGKMVPQIGDFVGGRVGQLVRMKNTDIGVQICYEIIFPDLSAAMVGRGGDLIVNITNDAWFGKTAAPYQHFAMAVFRAVENRRSLVRAANTGISGFIDPVGRVLDASALFTKKTMTRDVPVIRNYETVYTARGNMLPAVCLLAALLIILANGRKWLSRRPHH